MGSLTESSLKKNLSQFKKEINSFKEKNKIKYSDRFTDADYLSAVERGNMEAAHTQKVENINSHGNIVKEQARQRKNGRTQDSLFMHSFYVIADIGYGRELLKLYVEELNNANSSNNTHRAYQLQNIEKQKLSAKGSQKNSASPVVSASDVKIISDLFTLVKRNDYRFKSNTASNVVDKDGKTLVMYHQTGADFTVFDTESKGAGKYDDETPNGIFLKPTNSDIGLQGQKQ